MLQLALLFGIVSPVLLKQGLNAALLAHVTAVLRLSLALTVGVTVYGAVLYGMVELVPNHWPTARFVYGIGMAAAALLAIGAAAQAAPLRLQSVVVVMISALTAMLPIGLYLQDRPFSVAQTGHIWYFVGSLVGSFAASQLVPGARATPQTAATVAC